MDNLDTQTTLGTIYRTKTNKTRIDNLDTQTTLDTIYITKTNKTRIDNLDTQTTLDTIYITKTNKAKHRKLKITTEGEPRCSQMVNSSCFIRHLRCDRF